MLTYEEACRLAEAGRVHQLISDPTCRSVSVPPEILAAAEEIADGSDVLGLEKSRLDTLLRVVLYLERSRRPPA